MGKTFKKIVLTFVLVCAGAVSAFAQELSPFPPPKSDKVPPSDIYAADALKNSPRHGEMIDIKMPDGQVVKSWIVYPAATGKVGVVIVIHEIFGLTDWVRGVADQVAKDGFIAIAPDLESGFGPNGGGTAEAGAQATTVIRQVTPAITNTRLAAIEAYGKSLPSSNGKTATVGFCWGGSASFGAAVALPDLAGAVVFYGSAPMATVDGKQVPDEAKLAQIKAPVLDFQGGADARTSATIEPTKAAMTKLGKTFNATIFPGALHGFVREQGNDKDLTDFHAVEVAWPQVVAFFKTQLK